jgi:hypothetical protein
MENFNETNKISESADLQGNNFTEREPTNEERWVNDVNKEFDEDVPLVNEEDPDEDIPLEEEEDFEEDSPLNDEEIAGEMPIEEPSEDFEDDDLFPEDDDIFEDEDDDVEFK